MALEWYLVSIPDAPCESLPMHQTGLDEQLSPEQYISSGIHTNAIPFSNEAQWTIERRAEREATRYTSPLFVGIRRIVAIGEVSAKLISSNLEMLRGGDIDVLEVVVMKSSPNAA